LDVPGISGDDVGPGKKENLGYGRKIRNRKRNRNSKKVGAKDTGEVSHCMHGRWGTALSTPAPWPTPFLYNPSLGGARRGAKSP
jgi:hypothetical protein